jgi:hypothetical protein
MAAMGVGFMSTPTTVAHLDSPVLTYARLLREVHALIAQGLGDSPKAEALADEMDAPWFAMTKEEQLRMGGLSVDLYALAEGGAKQVEMNEDEVRAWKETAKNTFTVMKTEDIDSALAFLRRSSPRQLPRYVVPFLQARCWEKLGDLETALVFMKEAERHDPHQAISVLTLLQALGRVDESATYSDRVFAIPPFSGNNELLVG